MEKFKVGQTIEITGVATYFAGSRTVTITAVQPQYNEHGDMYYDWQDGLLVKSPTGATAWVHKCDVLSIIED